MIKHTVRIENHTGQPSRRRNRAEITITPPLANLSQVALAAVGLESTNILIQTVARDDSSTVIVETYGVVAERTEAVHLLADRLSLLTAKSTDLCELSQDTPFSHEGWAALRNQVNSPDFSNANPYYGRLDMPDYTPRRLIEN